MKTETKSDDTESIDSHLKSWSADIELVLTNILDNSKKMSIIHKNNYLVLRHYLFLIRLPIIVLSSINSVLSVGLVNFVGQSITSSTNCIISLICGILGSLELFIGIQGKSDREFETYQNLKLLSIKISQTLKLEPIHRDTSGLIFLKEIINDYKTTFENSLINSFEIDDVLLQYQTINNTTTTNKLLLESPRRIIISSSNNNLNSEL